MMFGCWVSRSPHPARRHGTHQEIVPLSARNTSRQWRWGRRGNHLWFSWASSSEADVDARRPITYLGLRLEVAGREVALVEGIDLRIDPRVIGDGPQISARHVRLSRLARNALAQRSGASKVSDSSLSLMNQPGSRNATEFPPPGRNVACASACCSSGAVLS